MSFMEMGFIFKMSNVNNINMTATQVAEAIIGHTLK